MSTGKRVKVYVIKTKLKTKLKKYNVIFMGTPEFAVPILRALLKSPFLTLDAVVTQPDRKIGRKQKIEHSPVKKLSLKRKVKFILQPEKVKEITKKIKELEPDLIIVVAFGQIIPKEILDIPKKGCLNIHPSLLPKYRGPSPIHTAILNNEKTAGITIILMDEEIDHGPIVAQVKVKITPEERAETLEKKLAQRGATLLIKILPDWFTGIIKPKPQDEKKATFTKLLRREDGKIYWDATAEEITRMIRAFDLWPATHSFWRVASKTEMPKKLKILKAKAITQKEKPKRPFGQVFLTTKKELVVQTGKGLLVIEKLQLEGKLPMTPDEFLNGYPQILGDTLI